MTVMTMSTPESEPALPELANAPAAPPTHGDVARHDEAAQTSGAAEGDDPYPLPSGLDLLAKGLFVQTHAEGHGVIATKRLSFDLAGADVSDMTRRLKMEPPKCGVMPENLASTIDRAVRGYHDVVKKYGFALSIVQVVHPGSRYYFVPEVTIAACNEALAAAQRDVRAAIDAAIATRAEWVAEVERLLRAFLAESLQRHRAVGHERSEAWVEEALARLMAQVPTAEDLAGIRVWDRSEKGSDLVAQLRVKHRQAGEQADLAVSEARLVAARIDQQTHEEQARREVAAQQARREMLQRTFEATLGDLVNPLQDMANGLRQAVRESLEVVQGSLERNQGRLTPPYKKRLEDTLALFKERNYAGDEEVMELIKPIEAYLATYRPPKRCARGTGTPAPLIEEDSIIQRLTRQLVQKTYEDARGAALNESAGAALDL